MHRYLYKAGFLQQHTFDCPVIVVGNLSFGGTGKSPHVAFLCQLLEQEGLQTAIVSRGYNRRKKGLIWVAVDDVAEDVGDEPLQFKKQMPSRPVVVCNKRAKAIEALLQDTSTQVDTILLDDALQHWAVKGTLNILLTTFSQPFFADEVAPAGYLREDKQGYQRAAIIIVTKCPQNISLQQKKDFLQSIQPLEHQHIYFTYYTYKQAYLFHKKTETLDIKSSSLDALFVFTGIADTAYLEDYLNQAVEDVTYQRFADHHYYTTDELLAMAQKAKGKTMLTTEKDAARLASHLDFIKEQGIHIYCLPIQVEVAFGEAPALLKNILRHIQ